MTTDLPPEIHPTAVVHPKALVESGVVIGPYSVIGDQVRIGQGSEIGAHVVLEGQVEIGQRCQIAHGAIIGTPPQDMKYVSGTVSGVRIGDGSVVREYVTIHRASKEGGWTIIGNDVWVLASSHIAHDCRIGNGVLIVNYAGLAGHVEVADYAVISGHTGIHPFSRIGTLSYIGGCSKVMRDVPPYVIVDGNPALAKGINVVGLRRRGISPEIRRELQRAFKILYCSRLSVSRALERTRSELGPSAEVNHLVEFVAASTRGICSGGEEPAGE
jgi:UDP-N-acetylglucosamine acyltransferase